MENQTTEIAAIKLYVIKAMEKMFLDCKSAAEIHGAIDSIIRLKHIELYSHSNDKWVDITSEQALEKVQAAIGHYPDGRWLKTTQSISFRHSLGWLENDDGFCLFLLETSECSDGSINPKITPTCHQTYVGMSAIFPD